MLNQPKKRSNLSAYVKSKTTMVEQASPPLALGESARAIVESRDGTIFERHGSQGAISPSMNRSSTLGKSPKDNA